MEETLNQILTALKDMHVDINELKQGQKSLKVGIENLEIGQQRLQEDLVESLGLYTEKIVQHVDDKTEVLNKRVYKVESEIERLSRQ